MDSTNGTSIVKAPQQAGTLGALIQAKMPNIRELCSRHITPEQVYRAAMLAIHNSPKLAECSAQSVLSCIMASAQLGLEFGTARQHAYLIPRAKVCTLQIGYRGLLSMAWRSPALSGINAFVCYKGENFRVKYGTENCIEHDPDFDGPMNDADITHAYAVCEFRGSTMFRVLSRKRLDQISKTSYTDGDYYRKHYSEWCCARAIKALMKWLPLDGEAEAAFSKISEEDDTVITTATEVPDVKQLQHDPLAGVETEEHPDDKKRESKPADDNFADDVLPLMGKN